MVGNIFVKEPRKCSEINYIRGKFDGMGSGTGFLLELFGQIYMIVFVIL